MEKRNKTAESQTKNVQNVKKNLFRNNLEWEERSWLEYLFVLIVITWTHGLHKLTHKPSESFE